MFLIIIVIITVIILFTYCQIENGLEVNGQECGEDTGGMMFDGLFSQRPFCLLFLIVSGSSFCIHMHSRQIHQEAQTRIVYPYLE